MNRKIYCILACALLLLASCKHQVKLKLLHKPTIHTKSLSETDKVNEVIKELKRQKACFDANNAACPATNGHTEYCNNDDCLKKVLGCHEIDSTRFNALLHEDGYYAKFTKDDIDYVLSDAQCGKQRIKFTIDKPKGWYYIETSNSMTVKPGPYEAYYSVALFQTIAALGSIASIEVYEGIATYVIPGTSTKFKIIPFKVFYSGDAVPRYYDVSDTEP